MTRKSPLAIRISSSLLLCAILTVGILALGALPQKTVGAEPASPAADSPDSPGSPDSPDSPDRSPTDLALTADGRLVLTTNLTADSVSLIDLTSGKVLQEAPVGKRPFALALAPDGKSALVTNRDSNSVSLLEISGSQLKPTLEVAVGDEPRGIALSSDGSRAFIALAGEDTVAVLDLAARRVVARWPVGWEPWHLALTPDGKRLVVGNTRSRTVSVLDSVTGKPFYSVRTLGRNLRHIAVSPEGDWAYLPSISERGLGVTRQNIDRGWVVGNRLTRIPLKEEGQREAITLDTEGEAVADLEGCAISPDGSLVALTAGGTHELLLLQRKDLPFVAYGGPGDHLDPALRNNPARLRRIPLKGRPQGVAFTPDGKAVVVANYLLNSVQVVEVASGQLLRSISLGGPASPSLARQGEAIFLDADRSFGSWYSCNTCHTEGHTNGGTFDTLNDGGFGKPKKTLSLRGIADTAPYTWHGWNKDLKSALAESLEKTMQGPQPTPAEVEAVAAYVRTLRFRKSPYLAPDGSLSGAARRGQTVFQEKACQSCHSGPHFSGPMVVAVGMEDPGDAYSGYNPPPLAGVYARAPYLHDGRARTLEAVLTEYHRPSTLTGKPDLTPGELADLVAYLKSL